MKKSLKFLSVGLFLILIVSSLAGCSSSKSAILGRWESVDSREYLEFFEDGDCEGSIDDYFDPRQWSITSDGTLKLTDNNTLGDGTKGYLRLKKSSSKELNENEYYLSGNTLIINGYFYAEHIGEFKRAK